MTEGDYDLVIVTKDLHTNLRVASEIRLRLVHSIAPVFQHLASSLPLDTVYTVANATAALSLELQVPETLELSYLEAVIVSPTTTGVDSTVDFAENSTNGTTMNDLLSLYY